MGATGTTIRTGTTMRAKPTPRDRSAGGEPPTVRRPDSSALGAGISILALGALLLLQDQEVIDFEPGWFLAALAALVGLALASRSLPGAEPVARTAPEREAERLSGAW